ncbi:MAG: CHASE domain-containing protein, partial [Alicycliphilus denitrificans]|nr:CHASE domain-containing protein [Alicycliphilus denitrificans]
MSFLTAVRFSPRLWLPGMAVALAGSVASYALWQQQQASMDAIAQLRFEQETHLFADALQRHLESHTDLLQGMRGLLIVDPQLRRAEFERVASKLSLARSHPGVKNINFTRYVPGAQRAAFEAQARGDAHMDGSLPVDFAIHPGQVRSEYFVVDFLWPREGNADVQGLEIHSQPDNLESMLRARTSGELAASAPFDLVQETERRTGIMIRLPVFADGVPPGQREAVRFLGTVGVSVRIDDVVQALRGEGHLKRLTLAMSDIGPSGAQAGSAALLFDSTPKPAQAADMERVQEVQVGGRRWRLQFQSAGSFLSAQEARLPWLLGLGGMLITALLTAVVSMLVLRRVRALGDVQQAGVALRESEERFRAVFSQAAVGMAQVDLHSDR